jgi:Holliday junction DNA helicase RuvA
VIDFVEGKLEEKGEDGAVISVGGLGLSLYVSLKTLQGLPAVGKKIRLYGYLHVREDLLQLYGFDDRRERELFLKLISVSGIGPKVAMALLSAYDPETFVRIISTEDLEAVTAVSGVGKKSGQRIILELKEKLSPLAEEVSITVGSVGTEDAFKEARDALKGLGYTTAESTRALDGYQADDGEARVEDLIKYALKRLGGAE